MIRKLAFAIGILLALGAFSSKLIAASMATSCVAHFGFSEWRSTLDEVGHDLFVYTKDNSFWTQGRYTESKHGGETTYFLSYDFGKSASLTVENGKYVLCLDSSSCSPCKVVN